MRNKTLYLALIFSLLVFSIACNKSWNYGNQDKWSKSYPQCAGQKQSPVDIKDAVSNPNLRPLFTEYYTVDSFELKLTPTTLKLYLPGSITAPDTAYFYGKQYYLTNIHFHIPSEHTINGKHYPMEIHFVHKDTAGNGLTLAVFVDTADTNPTLETIIANFPSKKNKKILIHEPLDINNLLPNSVSYWFYYGSKATPPCSENVEWFVMQQPVTCSSEQLKAFEKLIGKGNIRKTQPLNDRKIYKF